MKHLLFLLLWLPLTGFSQEQNNIDPIAISLIDKMGGVIGSFGNCAFSLSTVFDEDNFVATRITLKPGVLNWDPSLILTA